MLENDRNCGMQNAVWNSIDEFDDINTKDQYDVARKAGFSDEEALAACSRMSRDNARTPVQWSGGENAGFTTGKPWLKVNANYKEINVADQEKNEDSVLNYYRRLVAVRKSQEYRDVFTYGEFVPAYEDTETVMAYYRVDGDKRMLVAANFGKEAAEIELAYPVRRVALSNRTGIEVDCMPVLVNILRLDSCEAIVLECE